MSRILRRPMFRGGPVSSYGTGIASGLTNDTPGYKEGGQIGGGAIYGKPMGDRYGFAEPKLDTNIILQQVITDLGPNAEQSDIIEEYQKRIQTNEPSSEGGILDSFRDQFGIPVKSYPQIPQILYDTLNPSEETITERLQKSNPPDFGPGSKEPIIKTTDFQKRKKEYEEAELNKQIEIEKNKIKKTKETGTGTGTGGDGIGLKNFQEKSDKEVMQEYMDMFKESLGGDKDELNRQRYLEIAKFGANLMAQPGGQSLGESVGKAGGPALEGLSKIDAAERAGDRQAKTLGFQAALRKLEPGQIEKNIKDLSKYMSKDEAIKVATRQGEATNNLTKRKIIDGYAADIQSSPGAPSSAVIVKGLAETIFDYTVKEGKNISDFAPLTEKTTIEKDKLYYDKEGKIYKGKDDGTYIKVELSTSNE